MIVTTKELFAHAYGLLPWSKFKTITYDNGAGAKFRLKFYSGYSQKPAKETTNSNTLNAPSKVLVSSKSLKGKAPITLSIARGIPAEAYRDSSKCPGQFDVNNKNFDGAIIVCPISMQKTDIAYLAVFKSGKHNLGAFIIQDIDEKDQLKDLNSAQEFLKKVGLEPYKKDIKIILGSIKPLD